MSDFLHFDEESGCLAVLGELTIYQANAAMEGLRSAFASWNLSKIDLAGVTEVDTAGLQWLLVASHLSANSEESVILVNHSQPVIEVLALLGMEVVS